MVLRTDPRDRTDDGGDGRHPAEQLFERDGAGCYSLAVQLLDTPSIAAEVVAQVLGDAGRAGPAAQTRPRLLGEVHRRAVARLHDRPRPLDPARDEARAWNGLDDPPTRAVLAEMPVLARRAALLVYFAGYRLRELAEVLDRTPDELRAALHTAVQALHRDPRTSRAR